MSKKRLKNILQKWSIYRIHIDFFTLFLYTMYIQREERGEKMASVQKYKAHQVGRLLLHNNRQPDAAADQIAVPVGEMVFDTEQEGIGQDTDLTLEDTEAEAGTKTDAANTAARYTHSNECIDPTRTCLNYWLPLGTNMSPLISGDKKSANAAVVKLTERLGELFKVERGNRVVMAEVVVTLPETIDRNDEDTCAKFFEGIYQFYEKEFGKKNIINAVVHNDETRPHIHIDFVPVVQGRPNYSDSSYAKMLKEWEAENGEVQEYLCARELINRSYLKKMHIRLEKEMTDYMGFPCGLLNGATANGNKTVLRLKSETIQKQIEELEEEKRKRENELQAINALFIKAGLKPEDMELYPLIQRIIDLQNQVNIMKDIITANHLEYTVAQLRALQAKRYVPDANSRMSIFAGSLADTEIADKSIVVIEIGNKITKESPQSPFIKTEPEAERFVKMMSLTSPNSQVVIKAAKQKPRHYLFIRVDDNDPNGTFNALVQLEDKIKELNKEGSLTAQNIYMDSIESDHYNVAKAMLNRLKDILNVYYFVRLEQHEGGAEKQTEREML